MKAFTALLIFINDSSIFIIQTSIIPFTSRIDQMILKGDTGSNMKGLSKICHFSLLLNTWFCDFTIILLKFRLTFTFYAQLSSNEYNTFLSLLNWYPYILLQSIRLLSLETMTCMNHSLISDFSICFPVFISVQSLLPPPSWSTYQSSYSSTF